MLIMMVVMMMRKLLIRLKFGIEVGLGKKPP